MRRMERFLTVSEFAATFAIKDSTVRSWLLRRKIARVKVGRAARIPESEVKRLIEQGYIPARPERP